MWMFIEIGINLFQAWMMLYFMKQRLHMKNDQRVQEFFCLAGITVFLSLFYLVDLPFLDTFVFAIPILFAIISSKDSWYVCLFWGIVLAVLFLTTVPIVFNLLAAFPEVTYEMLLGKNKMRLIALLVTNGVLFLLIWTTRLLRKNYSKMYWPALITFLLAVVALFLTEEAIYAMQQETTNSDIWYGTLIQAYSGVLLGIFFTVILFHNMSRSMENESRYKMEVDAIEKARRYISELEMMYARMNEMKHDLKHHYQVVENLIEQGKKDEAENYARQTQMELEQAQYRWTGSSAIDVLILTKSMTMRQHKISFRFDPYPLKSLPIPESDFCALLGNVLDNAIEGTIRANPEQSRRMVQLSFSRSRDMLYIFCQNPCDENQIHRTKTEWLSSKKEHSRMETGVGIRSISRIAKEADGRCDFQVNDGLFTVKVVLPYSEKVDADDRVDH